VRNAGRVCAKSATHVSHGKERRVEKQKDAQHEEDAAEGGQPDADLWRGQGGRG
jgi:hypothetical protein